MGDGRKDCVERGSAIVPVDDDSRRAVLQVKMRRYTEFSV